MENLATYQPTRTPQIDYALLLQQNQQLNAAVTRLKKELKASKATVYQQQKTISDQTKTIRELNKNVIKSLEASKVELNKDKVTFIQAFGIKCREKSVLTKLNEFMQCEPTWSNLTQDKLQQFNQWIRASGGVKDSTACTYITLLKGVIRYGYINSNDASQALKSVRPVKEKKIWLRPEDLYEILNFTPTNNDEVYVRKMFLICCLTGCRVIDAPILSKENIDGSTLRYMPIKTKNKECFVSLSEKVKSVLLDLFSLEAYPPKEDANKVLKIIFRKCEITRKFDIGTPYTPNVVEICDAVHFHTARHSFATLKFRYSDWTERQQADALGHASFNQTFENYICDKSAVSDEEKELYRGNLFC